MEKRVMSEFIVSLLNLVTVTEQNEPNAQNDMRPSFVILWVH